MTDRSAEQFAQSCARCASHLASASFNAYADMAANSLRFWSDAADAWLATLSPAPARRRASHAAAMPFLPRSPMPSNAMWGLGQPWVSYTTPMAAWMGMLSATRLFGAFPLASALMAAGVPSSTAWPAAKASAAAIDAADIATRAVERAFSSYRSDGGHAVAQIVMAPAVASTAAVFGGPAILMAAQPWLKAWNANVR